MKKIILLSVLTATTYCFSMGIALAQNYLPNSVKAALHSAEVSETQLAASVVPLDGGKLNLNWREDRKIQPASTEKMITTLAALEMLGPDWRWKTAFSYTGDWQNGTLKGTLYVKGGGDPKYVAENLWRDLSRMKSMGIEKISADVVIDRSYFEHYAQDPEFQDDWDRPYTAEADAALLNYQSIAMKISPDQQAGLATVTVSPEVLSLNVPKTVPLAASKRCVRWRQALDLKTEDPWNPKFAGALPSGCEEKTLAYLVSKPNEYWKVYLETLCKQVGIAWRGRVKSGIVPSDAKPLFDVWSDDLGTLVKLTNKFSNNVFARHMFLTLAAKDNPGVPATYTHAREVLDAWLHYAVKVSPGDIFVDNGSGLTRKSRVTARAMTRLIAYGWRSPRMPEWISSFPISGVDGTMNKRAVAQGSAYIKTGLLRDVKSAGGLIQAKSGRRYAFFAAVEGKKATGSDAPIDRLIEWVYLNG